MQEDNNYNEEVFGVQDGFEEQEDFSYDFDAVDQNYTDPEQIDGYVDSITGKVVGKEDLTPFDMIKSIAKQTNTPIRDPKGSCNHCYGRGYIGIDFFTKSPVPCNCIYPPKDPNEKQGEQMYDNNRIGSKPNRAQKRRMRKMLMKDIRKQHKLYANKSEKTVEESDTNES